MRKIIFEGNFDQAGSYGIVNFNLALNFERVMGSVSVLPHDIQPDALQIQINSLGSSLRVSESNDLCDIRIRQVWPPIWDRVNPTEKLVVVQPWEYGSIPLSWLRSIENVDQVWVPSMYVKHCYVQSGVSPDKVFVVPNGVTDKSLEWGDRKLFTDQSSLASKPFTFLFLGGTIFRKGVDILIDALALLTESELESIEVIVKQVGADGAYRGQSLLEDRLSKYPDLNRVVRKIDKYLNEEELWTLIQSSDALIHPYRSEGFGMPVLEAMALGTPVIHTSNGATNEFCSSEVSVLIRSNLKIESFPVVSNMLLADQCWYYEVTPEVLAETMRNVIIHRNELPALARQAHQVAKNYSWSRVAETAAHALDALENKSKSRDIFTSILEKVESYDYAQPHEKVSPFSVVQDLVNIGDYHSAYLYLGLAERPFGEEFGVIERQLAGIV